jgi:hypothetical protein
MPTRSGAVYNPQQFVPLAMSENVPPAGQAPVAAHPPGDQGGDHGPDAHDDNIMVAQVLAANPADVVACSDAVGTSHGRMMDVRPSLPKDSIKLLKFKGVSDLSTLEDFLFQLELYFDAMPGTYDFTVNPNALHHRFVVVVGCFPPGSVSAVWFRSMFKADKFESWHVFLELLYEQFARHAADLVALQNRWEHASQRRAQSAYEYYAFLLKLQASIAAVGWEHRPSNTSLLTKYCASVRVDLQRYLQEKRIDHPEYSLHQLVQIAGVRESSLRSAPRFDAMNGRGAGTDTQQKYCFFCKSNTHSAADCRKIAAKKARGEWKERPRAANK